MKNEEKHMDTNSFPTLKETNYENVCFCLLLKVRFVLLISNEPEHESAEDEFKDDHRVGLNENQLKHLVLLNHHQTTDQRQ